MKTLVYVVQVTRVPVTSRYERGVFLPPSSGWNDICKLKSRHCGSSIEQLPAALPTPLNRWQRFILLGYKTGRRDAVVTIIVRPTVGSWTLGSVSGEKGVSKAGWCLNSNV